MNNPMSDIKVSDRRSVRRIPLPEKRRRDEEADGNDEPLLYENDRLESIEIEDSRWSKVALWLAVSSCIAVLLIVLSWTFTGATVTVTPKRTTVTLSDDFSAERVGGSLSFTLAPFQKIGEETVPALAKKRVSDRASGTIVVYNNFSDRPQRLIKNTRFESPQGRIYRIDRSIVVPGQKKSGTELTPGSVEAVVFADSPGESFNSPLTDFTVPGFKNDPGRYAGFYARSKTALTGGFEGTVPVPTETAEKAAREKIRLKITEELLAEAKQSVPNDSAFLKGAYRVVTESLPHQERGESEAVVREKMTLTALYLPRAELTQAIARKKLPQYDGKPVSIETLETLIATLKSAGSTDEKISFSVAGEARIVSLFDEAALAEALRGKPKNGVAPVLSSFPAIEKVDVILRPFWRRSFPEKAGKIKIESRAEAENR